jgi:hypothetical protein
LHLAVEQIASQKQFADAALWFFRETLPNEWQTFRDQMADNFGVSPVYLSCALMIVHHCVEKAVSHQDVHPATGSVIGLQ